MRSCPLNPCDGPYSVHNFVVHAPLFRAPLPLFRAPTSSIFWCKSHICPRSHTLFRALVFLIRALPGLRPYIRFSRPCLARSSSVHFFFPPPCLIRANPCSSVLIRAPNPFSPRLAHLLDLSGPSPHHPVALVCAPDCEVDARARERFWVYSLCHTPHVASSPP